MASVVQLHKQTAYTHGCIKAPVSKLKKTPVTLHNRKDRVTYDPNLQIHTEQIENPLFSTLQAANGDLVKASEILDMKLEATNAMIKELTDNFNKLSDEEFFRQLTTLKLEHKKTLQLCETLYTMKKSHENFEVTASKPQALTSTTETNMHRSSARDVSSGFAPSSSLDLSNSFGEGYLLAGDRKPPVAPHRSDTEPSRRMHESRTVAWSEEPPEVAPAVTLRTRHHSADNESSGQFWRSRVDTSSDEDLPTAGQLATTEAQQRVRSLWQDFSLLDYTSADEERQPRHRTSSLDGSKRVSTTPTTDLADHWRHRITIPEPFEMTVREENKPLRKSRSMIAFEQDQLERQKAEEAELSKRFRANPVPAHVYVPLLDELFEKQEAKRQFVKAYSKEILESSQKPFNFTKRDEERKRQDTEACHDAKEMKKFLHSTEGDRLTTVHKPVPLPPSTYKDHSRRIQEDQLYRQVKNKIRAENLLRKSSEPKGMKQRQQAKLAKRSAEDEKEARRAARHQGKGFRPRTRDIPDYGTLQRNFEEELWRTKAENKVTRPRPFKLHTEERSKTKSAKKRQPQQQRRSEPSRRSQDEWNRALLTSMEVPLPSGTNASAYREMKTREFVLSERQRNRERENEKRNRQKRQAELARNLRESVEFGPGKTVEAITKEKLRDLRRTNIEREREYQMQLKEIEDKIRARPLLVEQEARFMAEKRADARYNKTLHDQGLEREFVDHKAEEYRESDLEHYTYADDFDADVLDSPPRRHTDIEDVGSDEEADRN